MDLSLSTPFPPNSHVFLSFLVFNLGNRTPAVHPLINVICFSLERDGGTKKKTPRIHKEDSSASLMDHNSVLIIPPIRSLLTEMFQQTSFPISFLFFFSKRGPPLFTFLPSQRGQLNSCLLAPHAHKRGLRVHAKPPRCVRLTHGNLKGGARGHKGGEKGKRKMRFLPDKQQQQRHFATAVPPPPPPHRPRGSAESPGMWLLVRRPGLSFEL